jgi:hypothetical protein
MPHLQVNITLNDDLSGSLECLALQHQAGDLRKLQPWDTLRDIFVNPHPKRLHAIVEYDKIGELCLLESVISLV